ncbi:MAG: DUF3943 domain-containing protein [Gammaproteobacteria bacterium]|nr:DUF3943 domain-containing protein [Gammaproteobacteria bacterium]
MPLETAVALNDDTAASAELPPGTPKVTGLKSLPDNNRILSNGMVLSIPEQSDSAGLWLDTKLFLLYQVGVVTVLYFSPESVSKWSTQQKNGNPFRKWNDNVNSLRRDHDRWEVNYIGHPYFGAVYYTRARNRGFSREQSLGYATAMSTLYEYGIEAIFEPASVQDLIFTPVGGAVLGEYFMIGRQKILNKIDATGEKTWTDSVALFLIDPLGAVNKSVLRTFGKQSSLDVFPTVSPERGVADKSIHNNIGVVGLLQW